MTVTPGVGEVAVAVRLVTAWVGVVVGHGDGRVDGVPRPEHAVAGDARVLRLDRHVLHARAGAGPGGGGAPRARPGRSGAHGGGGTTGGRPSSTPSAGEGPALEHAGRPLRHPSTDQAADDPSPSRGSVPRGCAAWASWPGRKRPVPSHHGHSTVAGVPVRFETTRPVPRHALQGGGAGGIVGRGVLVGHRGTEATVGGHGRRRPLRPLPHRGRCTWATCAPRCWPGWPRAAGRRASSCASRTSTPGASGAASRPSSSPTWPRSGWTGTGPSCGSPSAARATTTRWAAWRPTGGSTRAGARGARSARPPRRRTATCRRAPTPAPAAA